MRLLGNLGSQLNNGVINIGPTGSIMVQIWLVGSQITKQIDIPDNVQELKEIKCNSENSWVD